MKTDFRFKAYATPENTDELENIYIFDNEELIVVYDLFVRLSKKFLQVHRSNISEVKLTDEGRTISVEINKNGDISSEEFEFYTESLMGFDSDNIINFDSVNYIIRGIII